MIKYKEKAVFMESTTSEKIAIQSKKESLELYSNAKIAEELGNSASIRYENELSRGKNRRMYDSEKLSRHRTKAIEEYERASVFLKRAGEEELFGAENERKDIVKAGRERNANLYFESADAILEKINKIKHMGRKHSKKTLEGMSSINLIFSMISMVVFGLAFYFSSFSMTGLAVTENITTTTDYIVFIFFTLGIIFAGIYLFRIIKAAKIKKHSMREITKKKISKKK